MMDLEYFGCRYTPRSAISAAVWLLLRFLFIDPVISIGANSVGVRGSVPTPKFGCGGLLNGGPS